MTSLRWGRSVESFRRCKHVHLPAERANQARSSDANSLVIVDNGSYVISAQAMNLGSSDTNTVLHAQGYL